MKYYTAFIYDDAAEVHCTHKYLGTQSDEDYKAICELISYFFEVEQTFPCIMFNQRAFFGPKRNIPVLKPNAPCAGLLFPALREALDGYRPDDYGGYAPHLTTAATEIHQPFKYYAIMCGDKVLKKWR